MSGKSHFHCCYCSATVITRANLMKHIATHASPPTQPQSSSVQQTPLSPPRSSRRRLSLPRSSSATSVLLGPADTTSVLLGPADAGQQTLPQSSSVQQTPPQSSSVQQTHRPPRSSRRWFSRRRLQVQQTHLQLLQQTLSLPRSSRRPSVLLGLADTASVLLGPADAGSADAASVTCHPPKMLSSKKRTVTCSQCDLTLLAKNLRTHIRRHQLKKKIQLLLRGTFNLSALMKKLAFLLLKRLFLVKQHPYMW